MKIVGPDISVLGLLDLKYIILWNKGIQSVMEVVPSNEIQDRITEKFVKRARETARYGV